LSTTILLLASCLVASAAFVPMGMVRRRSWIRELFERKRMTKVAERPRITHDHGWTFIQCDDYDSFQEWLGRDEEGFPFKNGEQPSLGSHLLVELFDCDQDSLKFEDRVGHAMREAAVQSKATVVAESFHEFQPFGVSGAVIIQESHYTIHTWPEHGYAAVDLFYCGGTVHVHKAIDSLQERFKPGRMKFLVVRRGIQSEVERD